MKEVSYFFSVMLHIFAFCVMCGVMKILFTLNTFEMFIGSLLWIVSGTIITKRFWLPHLVDKAGNDLDARASYTHREVTLAILRHILCGPFALVTYGIAILLKRMSAKLEEKYPHLGDRQ